MEVNSACAFFMRCRKEHSNPGSMRLPGLSGPAICILQRSGAATTELNIRLLRRSPQLFDRACDILIRLACDCWYHARRVDPVASKNDLTSRFHYTNFNMTSAWVARRAPK